MKILSYILSIITFFVASSCFANSDKQQIIQKLKALQEQGITQSETYQYSDIEQLKQCTGAANPFRKEAKELQQVIMSSNDVIFRVPAYQAADLAFSCVYCSDNAVESCKKMTKYLERAQKSVAIQ
ncbi:hypothetical protein [Vibrio spartinae]|uniref:Lipoprotein n=1 Tax=Vibrio spartinae TaxID=1918945 RepID=A0A1N6M5E0_9VIBR|nr:hypothetical protein [Vibrio spartinae]SIO94648.1 hypothetical protein VSP9026_02376 [Vibrio spartinae]